MDRDETEKTGIPSALNSAERDDSLWLPVSPEQDKNLSSRSAKVGIRGSPVDGALLDAGISIEAPGVWDTLRFRIGLALLRPLAWFKTALENERDDGGLFLWLPVMFGLGCVIYFNLPREPLTYAFPALAGLLVLLVWKIGQSSPLFVPIVACLLLVSGITAAQWRTHSVDTPMMSGTHFGAVKGEVLRAERRANGSVRYTIRLAPISKNGRSKLNADVARITARKGGPSIDVGEWVKGKARLAAPPGPAFPGAYDFSFQTWFNGIGASGFFLGKPEKVNSPIVGPSGYKMLIARTRASVSNIIRKALPGRSGGLAAALIVGDRSGIDDQTSEALRRSGLAHILAISGLHMALVAVTVIYLLRAVLASSPGVALRYPIKKWASAAALIAATIYLLLSGASVSTQRAYIMVAIMLIAVLTDRRALTMRNVALAALIVLFLAPEAVLSPGFQMSFAAVAALVGVYETLSKRNSNNTHRGGVVGVVQRFLVRDILGLATTSLVAGAATGLFAAYHFYRVAPFGLVANLLAMPIVTFAVMPFALLSMLLMPFGLEVYPLSAMAIAMEKVVAIAEWVATLEPHGNTGLVPIGAMVLGTISLLLATLLRSSMKMFAIPFAIASAMSFSVRSVPDVLILENGNQIGVIESGRELRLLRPNAEKFSTGIWEKAFGSMIVKSEKTKKRGANGPGFMCDKFGCSTRVKGKIIAHIRNTARLNEDCVLANVLVIPYQMPHACGFMEEGERPLILDRTALSLYGAHMLTIQNEAQVQGPKQISGYENRRNAGMTIRRPYTSEPRPWTRHRSPNAARP